MRNVNCREPACAQFCGCENVETAVYSLFVCTRTHTSTHTRTRMRLGRADLNAFCARRPCKCVELGRLFVCVCARDLQVHYNIYVHSDGMKSSGGTKRTACARTDEEKARTHAHAHARITECTQTVKAGARTHARTCSSCRVSYLVVFVCKLLTFAAGCARPMMMRMAAAVQQRRVNWLAFI